jgi:hypothetical protein
LWRTPRKTYTWSTLPGGSLTVIIQSHNLLNSFLTALVTAVVPAALILSIHTATFSMGYGFGVLVARLTLSRDTASETADATHGSSASPLVQRCEKSSLLCKLVNVVESIEARRLLGARKYVGVPFCPLCDCEDAAPTLNLSDAWCRNCVLAEFDSISCWWSVQRAVLRCERWAASSSSCWVPQPPECSLDITAQLW